MYTQIYSKLFLLCSKLHYSVEVCICCSHVQLYNRAVCAWCSFGSTLILKLIDKDCNENVQTARQCELCLINHCCLWMNFMFHACIFLLPNTKSALIPCFFFFCTSNCFCIMYYARKPIIFVFNFGSVFDHYCQSVFWATVCKTVRPMLSDRCLSVCL